MPFLTIPFSFQEEDEITGKLSPVYENTLSINTAHIVTYNASQDGAKTIISLSDGRQVIVEIDVDSFEDILAGVDNIFELNTIAKN